MRALSPYRGERKSSPKTNHNSNRRSSELTTNEVRCNNLKHVQLDISNNFIANKCHCFFKIKFV